MFATLPAIAAGDELACHDINQIRLRGGIMKVTKLLDATQARWRLLPSLTLVGTSNHLPNWAIDAAQHVALEIQPAEVAIYRAQLRRRAEQLAMLHRRWVVAAVLAVLLAAAVVSNASGMVLDNLHLGVLS